MIAVGGSSPPNTEQSSETPPNDSTQREAQAAQLGAALERERVLSEETARDRMRIESLESTLTEERAQRRTLEEKVDALLSAVTEPETPDDTMEVTPTEEPPAPEPEPERIPGFWARLCDKINGA